MHTWDFSVVSRGSGAGRGNWGGQNLGERLNYTTDFDDVLCFMQLTPKTGRYEATLRGIGEALKLDRDTFHRYRTGEYKLPAVVKADMYALVSDDVPPPFYWDYVELFRIKPTFRVMEDTEKRESVLEVELNGTTFHVRKFWMQVNRQFRDVIYRYTEEHTPILDREDWRPILDEALSGGYSGALASKKSAEYDTRVAIWRDSQIPFWKRKKPIVLGQPQSPWRERSSGVFMHEYTHQIIYVPDPNVPPRTSDSSD